MTTNLSTPARRQKSTRFPLFSRVRHPSEVRILTTHSAGQFFLFGVFQVVGAFYYSSVWAGVCAVVFFATAVFLTRHFGRLAVAIGLCVALVQAGFAVHGILTRPEPAADAMDGRGIVLVLVAGLVYSVARLVPVAHNFIQVGNEFSARSPTSR